MVTKKRKKASDWTYDGLVAEVIDGDTIRVSIDLGFEIFQRKVVRLAGINAPDKQDGAALQNASKAALERLLPAGSAVTLKTEKPQEKFGRYLAHVTRHDGLDVCAEMVRLGRAKKWDGKGERPV